MTIAEVNVTLRLALPQGWTKEDIENRINDILVERVEADSTLVEFDITDTLVNANPFDQLRAQTKQYGELQRAIQQLPNSIGPGGLVPLSPWYRGGS